METFREYRFRHGLVGADISTQDLEIARKAYRKKYLQAYRKKRNTSLIRKEITLTPQENQRLEKFARQYGKPPSQFIKICTLSFMEKEPLIPNPKELAELVYQIRKIGVNINQIAYVVNREGKAHFDAKTCIQELSKLEYIITQAVTKPTEKREVIRGNIKETMGV